MRLMLALLILATPCYADVVEHVQNGAENTVFCDVGLSVSGNVLSLAGGDCWISGSKYTLPDYSADVGEDAFALWVEKTDTGADYLLDLTNLADYNSFGQGIGAVKLAWRDRKGDEIHVLKSVR